MRRSSVEIAEGLQGIGRGHGGRCKRNLEVGLRLGAQHSYACLEAPDVESGLVPSCGECEPGPMTLEFLGRAEHRVNAYVHLSLHLSFEIPFPALIFAPLLLNLAFAIYPFADEPQRF